MTPVFYFELNAIAIIMLIIVYSNAKSVGSDTSDNRMFRVIVLLTIFNLFMDWFSRWVDGRSGNAAYMANLWSNAALFILSTLISYLWVPYCKLHLSGVPLQRKKRIVLAIPMVFIFVLAVTSYWNGSIYTVNADNIYVRGRWFILQGIVGMGYLFVAAVYSLYRMRQEIQRDKKLDCIFAAAFVVMPFSAGIIQMMYYGITLVWHCVALSLLMVYINIQSHQITLDPLTKLNNRGHLNRYLAGKCSTSDNAVPIYLAIIDVDEFKSINDSFGHLVGDAALIQTAELLKDCFNSYGAFLARYGGDEYAVVYQGEEAKFLEAIDNLLIKRSEINKKGNNPYKLQFSIGYAKFGTEQTKTVEEFVSLADRNMYRDKKKRKAAIE